MTQTEVDTAGVDHGSYLEERRTYQPRYERAAAVIENSPILTGVIARAAIHPFLVHADGKTKGYSIQIGNGRRYHFSVDDEYDWEHYHDIFLDRQPVLIISRGDDVEIEGEIVEPKSHVQSIHRSCKIYGNGNVEYRSDDLDPEYFSNITKEQGKLAAEQARFALVDAMLTEFEADFPVSFHFPPVDKSCNMKLYATTSMELEEP